jgi:hypothetical protein
MGVILREMLTRASTCFTAAILLGALSGCDDEPGIAAVLGTIDEATFARPIQSVIVLADDGMNDRVVPHHGTFRLTLRGDDSYRIVLQQDGPSIPVVFAGSHGVYDLSLRVRGDDAEVDLGRLRFFDNAPAEDPSAECVDGYYAGIEPCIGGEATITCDGDDHGGRGKGGGADLVPVEGPVAVPELGVSGSLGCGHGDHGHDDDDGSHDDDDGGGHDDDD